MSRLAVSEANLDRPVEAVSFEAILAAVDAAARRPAHVEVADDLERCRQSHAEQHGIDVGLTRGCPNHGSLCAAAHGQADRADGRRLLGSECHIDLILFRGDDRVRRLDAVGQAADRQRDSVGETSEALGNNAHLDLPAAVERQGVGALGGSRIDRHKRQPEAGRGRRGLGRRRRLDVRRGRQREAVDVRLPAFEIGIGDAHPVDAGLVRGKAEERVGAEMVVVLGDDPAAWIEQLEARVERRAEAGGIDLTGHGLPLAQGEGPVVDVAAREDAAVDRDRQLDLDRHRVAVDLLFHDLGKVADDEREPGRRPLRGPEPGAARAERCLGGDADFTGHIARIVLGLLRIGQRQQRPFKPQGRRTADRIGRRDAGAEQLEATGFVKEQAADPHRHGGAALSAGGKEIRRDRRIGSERFTTKAQRTQRREKEEENPERRRMMRQAHGSHFSHWSALCS